MKVKNWRGGNRPVPSGYSSWLDYWEKKSGGIAMFCCVKGCCEFAEDGAHVFKPEEEDGRVFIAPTCHKHNMDLGGVLEIEDNTKLVPVNE